MKKNEYSLFTTVAMIVGIVIGSGIFFKSDNILVATGGSIGLGVLLFTVAAISIIFGGLSIAELASRNSNSGGIIAYAESSYNKSVACSFGWFQTFLYFPSITAVLSWIFGVFLCMLFGVNTSLFVQMLIGFIAMAVLFITNVLSVKIGAYIQNAATIIKLLPLLFIAVAGLIFGNPGSAFTNTTSQGVPSSVWIGAIAPIAYSFDGWIVSTSISSEIKNPKRNLPLALIISPLIILLVYILYFIGITTLVGPSKVMELGDSHVSFAATMILGNFGAKILLTFVVISIMGTLNGIIIGSIRLPHALSERGMYPNSKLFSKINTNYGVSVHSAIAAFSVCSIWVIINFITQQFNLLPNSDVSDIAIAFNYAGYILLYLYIYKMKIKGEIKGIFRGIVTPTLAILGSIIVLGGVFNNPLFIYYLIFSAVIIILAIVFWRNKSNLNID